MIIKVGTSFLVCFLLTLAVLISEESKDAQTARVMTYNIRYDTPADGVNAWPNRKDSVAQMFLRYQVDLAGLQEALKHQIEDLAARLPQYSWIGVGRDDGREEGEFSPVFYRSDRFEARKQGTFWLSQTPKVSGSKSWDAAITRIVTWVEFRNRQTRKTFYFFNTHFDHRGAQARVESARLLARQVRSIAENRPTIVTGDFNTPPNSDPYLALVAGGLTDAFSASRAGHDGPTASFTDWREPRPAGTRIDYIFVRKNVPVLSHRILTDQFNGYFPSDHLPVLAEVRIP